MQYGVEWFLDVYVLGDIVVNELEPMATFEVGDVVHTPSDQVVHRDHLVTFVHKAIAKVRSDETSSTCDQYPHGLPLLAPDEIFAPAPEDAQRKHQHECQVHQKDGVVYEPVCHRGDEAAKQAQHNGPLI